MAIVTKNWTSLRSRDLVELVCDNCSKTLWQKKHRVQDALSKTGKPMFCSLSCAIEHRTEYVEGNCENCDMPIKRCLKDWIKTNHHFCTHRCAALYSNKNSTWIKTRGPVPTKPKRIPKFKRNGNYLKIEITCQECGVRFQGIKKRKYCSRMCSGKNAYRPNSTIRHRSVYRGFQLDSGAELYFAKEMDAREIKWLKNDGKVFKKHFLYTDKHGKVRKYHPDFYLPDHGVWVEIKGRKYQSENDQIKLTSIGTKAFYLISNEFRESIPGFFVELDSYRLSINGGCNEG